MKTVKFMRRDIITSTITWHLGLVGSNNFGECTSFSPFTLVVMPRCRVVVFEEPEVIDKTEWGDQRHRTSHDAGMVDTADVSCMSDTWHAYTKAASFETTSLWQINIT